MTVRLSVLDQSPIVSGGSSADVLGATVAMAQRADQLGYHHYWLAKHHNMRGLADPYTDRDRTIIERERSRAIIGTPDKVKARLLEIADAYAADELMVVTITDDYASRTRSYELLAAEFALDPPTSPRRADTLPTKSADCG